MIGCFKNSRENPVGGASKNKKKLDRLDSEGQYGRWKLRVMGSWILIMYKL